ncbi:hypothetical protein QLS71_007440 [Mariniflexile litorale]|uniref:PKD domain-containing protein n=1 Tax=Mariniflexile litorale TaxID=3045158 RepID=A0AAU7EJZ8_9FLAO|nr:hypothetical protein [Mariniflexile sp. KMM 9835]MDQ8211219.1 hypothetical protein [Mariniflexile sp. KMM 9835]
MKTLKYIFSLSLIVIVFFNCTEDDNDLSFVDNVVAPSNVSALFQITQDNTGLVTITPNAENATSYTIKFGDGTGEEVTVKQGESTTRIYTEGTYSVVIEAIGITGLKTEVTKELPVYFRAPENLEVKAEIDSSNPFVLNVSATADYAASFLVYFDTSNTDEEPTILALDETVSFEYLSVGDYTIKVVALSGGTEVTEATQVITIEKPTQLPIDFEIFDATVFQGFGGASNEVIDNPDTNGNSSSKVGKIVKGGPENWAGNVITLSAPIDFSTKKFITMNVWSPRAGGKVVLKLENLTEASTNMEVEATTVGNSTWEEVTFDFSEIDTSKSYQKLVLFFDIGTIGTGSADWTFYIDNIKQTTGPVSNYAPLIFDDFDGNSNITTWAQDASVLTLNTANVFNKGINTSLKVLKYDDNGGQYANIRFDAAGNFDLSTSSTFTLKLYVPSSGLTGSQTNKIQLKLQNGTAAEPWAMQSAIEKNIVLDQWQEITFDFANDGILGSANPLARTDFNRVVLQLNGENNTDHVIGYFDDFAYGSTPPADTAPFATDDFEGNGTITTWAQDGSVVDTAFPIGVLKTGMNYSNTVLKYDDNGSGDYANIRFDVTPNFNLNQKSKFTLKLYVPTSGLTGSQTNKIQLKLQDGTAAEPWVLQTVIEKTIVLDQWQEITFDFASDVVLGQQNPLDRTDFSRIVIQLNGEGNSDKVIGYIDDFKYHN